MKILTTYINADEGTAIVNGNNVNTQQKTFNFLLAICGTQSVVFGFVCEGIFSFNADVYKVAKSRIEETFN